MSLLLRVRNVMTNEAANGRGKRTQISHCKHASKKRNRKPRSTTKLAAFKKKKAFFSLRELSRTKKKTLKELPASIQKSQDQLQRNTASVFYTYISSNDVLFAWLISHEATVLFSQNKSVTSNQPAVLFSQNEPASAISHQPPAKQTGCGHERREA
jgi:hypothetical protein